MPTDPGNLGYLAALVDGEGHICIENGIHRSVLVGVTNTDLDLLSWLEAIGGKVTWKKTPDDSRYGDKRCGTWQLRARNDCLDFLQRVMPFMRIKKTKATQAIQTINQWLVEKPAHLTII